MQPHSSRSAKAGTAYNAHLTILAVRIVLHLLRGSKYYVITEELWAYEINYFPSLQPTMTLLTPTHSPTLSSKTTN